MNADIHQYSFRHWIINGISVYWENGQPPLYSQLRAAGYTSATVSDQHGHKRTIAL